jgi:hypothetical protein
MYTQTLPPYLSLSFPSISLPQILFPRVQNINLVSDREPEMRREIVLDTEGGIVMIAYPTLEDDDKKNLRVLLRSVGADAEMSGYYTARWTKIGEMMP